MTSFQVTAEADQQKEEQRLLQYMCFSNKNNNCLSDLLLLFPPKYIYVDVLLGKFYLLLPTPGFSLSYKLFGIMLIFSIPFPGLLRQVALMQSFLESLDPLQNLPSNTLS